MPNYRCLCKSGYEELSDSPGKCVLASRDEILVYGQQKPGVVRGLDLSEAVPKTEVMLPMIDLSRPTALDFHASANHIYLADSLKLKIERQNIKSGIKESFISSGKYYKQLFMSYTRKMLYILNIFRHYKRHGNGCGLDREKPLLD